LFINFDKKLFDSSDFKEDSVREVIIVPILQKLGYSPSGSNQVIRSKTLVHPFIYAGTRKIPVKLIPDYTLKCDGKIVLVLDAKNPDKDILSIESVQQVYSYAIHPEIKSHHFALCNGRQFVLFDVDHNEPIFLIEYENFEKNWDEVHKFLSPKNLKVPSLRDFAPDLGMAFARLGLKDASRIVLQPSSFNMVARVNQNMMTATANGDFNGSKHCMSLDFHPIFIRPMLSCLPNEISQLFMNSLDSHPFCAAAELMIEIDVITILGSEIEGEEERFRPLIVQHIISSRFKHTPPNDRYADALPNIFRLRDYIEI
jgi:hypothetical protein